MTNVSSTADGKINMWPGVENVFIDYIMLMDGCKYILCPVMKHVKRHKISSQGN